MNISTARDYFEGKPETYEIYKAIEKRIAALGPNEITVKSQISFGANRKFAWFWLYNVTRKDPNGIPHIMLAIDHRVDDSHVRDISHISNHRWNHQIVIRTLDDAKSDWLGRLLREAYSYGSK